MRTVAGLVPSHHKYILGTLVNLLTPRVAKRNNSSKDNGSPKELCFGNLATFNVGRQMFHGDISGFRP